MLIFEPFVMYSIAKLRKRAKAAGVNQNTVSTTL
jgi:hypothetical protein